MNNLRETSAGKIHESEIFIRKKKWYAPTTSDKLIFSLIDEIEIWNKTNEIKN